MSEELLATTWEFIGRNWAAIAISATVLSLLVWVSLVIAKYVRICLNIFTDTPPPLSMGQFDFTPIIGEEVRFRSFDGVSLRGMWRWAPRNTRPRGTIIFCHEFGSDMNSFARYTRPLLDAGFNVFTFDYRGHGQSAGPGAYKPLQWPSDKELGDTLGATTYAAHRLADMGLPTDLGLFGISRGASAAILAAASDENVKALLCDGAFSTQEVCIRMMKRWAQIFANLKLVYENHPPLFWRMLAWLMIRFARPKMHCNYPSVRQALREMAARPIMFIHGERDSYINVEQARMLYNVAPQPKYIWIVAGAKHNQSVAVASDEYAARTVAFFRMHLAGEQVDEDVLAACEGDRKPRRPGLKVS